MLFKEKSLFTVRIVRDTHTKMKSYCTDRNKKEMFINAWEYEETQKSEERKYGMEEGLRVILVTAEY
jgi:hypothetical protein